MDKRELEEKLEQEIKNFNEVPLSVDDKIEKAFMKIDAKKEKRISKFNFGKITKLVAEITTIAFLAGNGVAFATGNPNIYSWVLNKIGIQKEYEEIKTEVNQTVEGKYIDEDNLDNYKNSEIKLTLTDIGFDDNILVMGYKFNFNDLLESLKSGTAFDGVELKDYDEIKNEIEKNGFLEYQIMISDDKKDDYLLNYYFYGEDSNLFEIEYNDEEKYITNNYDMMTVNSNNEIVAYLVCDISNLNLSEVVNFKIKIKSLSIDAIEAGLSAIEGNWIFNLDNVVKSETIDVYIPQDLVYEFKIKDKYKHTIMKAEEYNNIEKNSEENDTPELIINGEKARIEIDRIQNSKLCTIIHSNINIEWTTADHSMFWYAMDIIDDEGNIILNKVAIKDKNYVMQKLEENKNYTIRIWQYYDSYITINHDLETKDYTYITSMNFQLSENN